MKYIIFTILFSFPVMVAFSQWTTKPETNSVYTNGYVSVGTSTIESTGRITVDAGFNDSAKQGIYIKATAGTNDSGPSLILDNVANWAPGRCFIRGISRNTSNAPTYTDISLYQGMVGINTNYPDATLAVNGQVHAKEVRVDLSFAGPDYVFEPTYELLPLEAVKAYIESYKHLPEVPSAHTMENNGIHVGEMNMILLKKVEELTLYTIQQNEKIKLLEERLLKLESGK